MSFNRIQKLLYSEYCEFEDVVLLESPFAEITREGKGIRQMQIGLTPTKLIMAQDIFDENIQTENSQDVQQIRFESVAVSPNLDAEIESLELVSIIPIDYVNLSLFVRGRKRAIKARLCNGHVFYFELGGSRHRKMMWNLWCEKLKYLSPGVAISSSSEASTTFSSSQSSAFLQKKCDSTTSSHKSRPSKLNNKYPEDIKIRKPNKFGVPSTRKPWTDRNLFLTEFDDGKGEFSVKKELLEKEESPKILLSYENCKGDSADKDNGKLPWSVSREVELNLINERQMTSVPAHRPRSALAGQKESQRSILVHRFDSGVPENCEIGLYLAPLESDRTKDNPYGNGGKLSSEDFINLMDSGVRMWEESKGLRKKRKSSSLHAHNFAAYPQFFNGLGPAGNYLSLAEKLLLQSRQAASAIELNKIDYSEFDFPFSKNQLVATVSYDTLILPFNATCERKKCEELLRKFPYTPFHSPPVFFWTPDLFYQAKPSKKVYQKQRQMMESLYCQTLHFDNEKNNDIQHKICSRTLHEHDSTISKSLNDHSKARRRKSNTVYEKEIRRKICITEGENWECEGYNCTITGQDNNMSKKSLTKFQPILKFCIKITAWDFNSTTIAYQLTMIDRDLFLQIPVSELGLIIHQKYHLKEKSFSYPLASLCNGTPCISALISFSHRISCLVSSAILEGKSIKARARLIAHFINVAHKCFQLQNFQSCHSILFGLQSPGIYRLRQTWNRIKLRYYNKYEIFEHLSRFYSNVQLTGYSGTSKYSRRIPFLPCISFIINYLQDFNPSLVLQNTSILAEFEKENVLSSQTGIQKSNDAKERKNLDQQYDLLNSKVEQENVSLDWRSRLLRSFLSILKIRRNEKGSGQTTKLSVAPIAKTIHSMEKNSDCCCWLDKGDKKLKVYFSPAVKEKFSSSDNSEHEKHFTGKKFECIDVSKQDNRMKIFQTAAEMLLSCQYCAFNYALPQSDLAKEYLLKARYKEQHKNYTLSLLIESA